MADIWAWVGRHGRAIKLGSVAAALVLLAGGMLIGMSSASGTQSSGALDTPPAAVQEVTSHYLVGTVVEAFTPGRFILRGRGGRFYVINYDKDTLVRSNRRPAQPGAVRRGARVIILGEPKDGRLHADVVTVTGYAPARQVPANQNQKRMTAPAPSATPTPPALRPTQGAVANPQPEPTPAAASFHAKSASPPASLPATEPRRAGESGAATAADVPAATPGRTLHSLVEPLLAERQRPAAATAASEVATPAAASTSTDPPAPTSTPRPSSVRPTTPTPIPESTPKSHVHLGTPRATPSPTRREPQPARSEPERRPGGGPHR